MSRYFLVRGETERLDEATRAQLRGDFIGLSAGVTHYELRGPAAGALVVLIPGLTIPLFYWDAVVSELHQRGLRTLAYSAYGRGYSDRVHATYDPTLFVDQLAELLKRLKVAGPPHLVGSSMGALIAMHAMDSGKVAAHTLTLVGPAGLSEHPPLPRVVAASEVLTNLAGRAAGPRALRKHLAHNVESPDLAAALAAMVAEGYRYEGSMYSLLSTMRAFPLANQQPLYERIGSAGVPTQLLWGSDDRVTPIAGLQEAKTLLRLAGNQVHIVESCGHMVPFEKPDTVADLTALFTARN